MIEHHFGYREVIPDQSLNENFNNILLTTGGSQSTLEDIKGIEKAGGYGYIDTSKHYMKNRFIYWRILSDTLELVEQSLDINLTDNKIRYRFSDSSIIDGISIHETEENVIILVPTVCSVHKLTFPHPSIYHKNDDVIGTHPNLAAPSIFAKVNPDSRDSNSFYIFNNSTSSVDQLPNLAASYYDTDTNEAIFIVSYAVVELLLIKLNSNGLAECVELHDESRISKFIAGLTEKFRTKQMDAKLVTSILIQQIQYEVYAIVLFRSGHIRLWSCKDANYITSIDLSTEIHFIKDKLNDAIIKSSINVNLNQNETEDTIAIFMSFPNECQFHILKLIINGDQVDIQKIQTLSSGENDLIDFSLENNSLWSAWYKSADEWVIYNTSIQTGIWIPIIKDAVYDVEEIPSFEGAGDPKQNYLQYLFNSRRFPLHIIKKSLSVYKNTSSIIAEMNPTTVATLKQTISLLVENDIQQRFSDSFAKDDDYTEHAEWCWKKFYSYCLQFHESGSRPLGLMLLPKNSAAILIKRSSISFLRPMELMEYMTLSNEYLYKNHLINADEFENESDVIDDILILFEAMSYLNKELSKTFRKNFELEMENSLKPNVVISDLVANLKMSTDNEYKDISNHIKMLLNQCSDLYRSISKLLHILRCDKLPHHYNQEFSNKPVTPCFNSPLAVSFISNCLRQQCETRFSICRNLLLICTILNDSKTLIPNVYETIYSVCEPEIIYLTQANYLLLWLTKLPALNNVPQDVNLHRLNPIKLIPVNNIQSNGNVFSLIELFALTIGGQEARKCFLLIDCSHEIMAHWHFSLLLFTESLRHILWPLNGNILLAEWMVTNGQHIWLQQYVRNLSNWCEWNMSSYSFLLAISFLMSGENYKALDYFTIAAEGIVDESYLQNKINKEQKDDQNNVNYYLKVIQLFEMHKARDCAIEMANIALNIIKDGNPLLSTIHSIKFKHHLSLKHYERAFYALKDNPEQERKKDNLRDFVKTLLDEKRFDILLNFTYGDMDELFTTILLTRARATDPAHNVFYDFLYSYQIKRGPLCYRLDFGNLVLHEGDSLISFLAASVMYERAFRLSYADNCDALEKQVKCYLAAKNVLLLVDPEYAWIVRPSDPDEEEKEIMLEPLAGSQDFRKILRIKKQVEVVNIETIDNELIFSYAKLKLCRFDSAIPTNVTNVVELVTLLNSSGLFKVALEICTAYKLSYVPIFEALTVRCISLSEEENPSAWDWLIENDLQNLPANRDSLSEVVWQLLQVFLEKYEEDNASILHKVVCKKIISMRSFIPFWLLSSYKKRNPSELLKLLHLSGRLDEAFDLAQGYLLAALGQRKEIYGLKMSLTAISPPLSLPVYQLQCLIKEFEMQNEVNSSKPFKNEYQILQTLFEKYLSTASRISIVH